MAKVPFLAPHCTLLFVEAVAREWFGNGVPPPVEGRLEFIQDTAMSVTHRWAEN